MKLFRIGTTIGFRTMRISFICASFLYFILFVSTVSGRPNDGELSYEFQNAKSVSTFKRHPSVYYKEDYVSEDFAPEKSETKGKKFESNPKYEKLNLQKNITEKFTKPEKVMFDFYPIEDDLKDDVTLNDNINVEIMSLYDNEMNIKKKRKHKKYNHNRAKRDVDTKVQDREALHTSFIDPKLADETPTHIIRRRNYNSYNPNLIRNSANPTFSLYSLYPVQMSIPAKVPIRGNYYNAISPGVLKDDSSVANRFGAEDETDKVYWPLRSPQSFHRQVSQLRPSFNQVTMRPTRRPAPPLIHDSSTDLEYRKSSDRSTPTRRPSQNQNSVPISNTRRPPPPLIHDTSSLVVERDRSTPTRRPQLPQNSIGSIPDQRTESPRAELSRCTWAIVSCCKRTNPEVRTYCFEQNGCSGPIWDLNVCDDYVQDIALNAAEKYHEIE